MMHRAFIVMALFALLAAPTSGFALTVAQFTDGNTSAATDGYPGAGGDGWNAGWSSLAGSGGTVSVANSTPLDGGGNYLVSSRTNAGDRTIGRRYLDHDGVDDAAPHMISWKWRFDGNIQQFGGSFNDRFAFYGNGAGVAGSTAANSWLIGLVAADRAGNDIFDNNWYFFDNNGSSDFNQTNMVNTGLTLQPGAVYDFKVLVDPVAGTYDAFMSDGANSASATGLTFRSGLTGAFPVIHFSSTASATNDNLAFALDAVRIEALIPEPATAALLVAGLSAVSLRRRRVM